MHQIPKAEDICLFLDVDGTLLELAPRPQDVVVPPALVGDLIRATERLQGGLALITGRSIEAVDRLFRPLRPRAAGIHGAQLRLERDGVIQFVGDRSILSEECRARFASLAEAFPGLLVEDKRASVAMHYRACPERREELRHAIATALESEPGESLTVLPGHFVFEVKREGYDKGTAVSEFMRTGSFKGRKPVVIGDDVSDEAAFQVAREMGGYGFSVGREVAGTSGSFESPAEVRDWLKQLILTHRAYPNRRVARGTFRPHVRIFAATKAAG